MYEISEYKSEDQFICRIKSCPWCGAFPELQFPINDADEKHVTWLWSIRCANSECNVQPKTKYVPIRKGQKRDLIVIKAKMAKLFSYWNIGLPGLYGFLKIVDLRPLKGENV